MNAKDGAYTRTGGGDGTSPPLLTDEEHRAVDLAGEVYTLLANIIDDGPSADADLAEIALHVHNLQNAVLAQAAARAYPERYRVMGGVVGR